MNGPFPGQAQYDLPSMAWSSGVGEWLGSVPTRNLKRPGSIGDGLI